MTVACDADADADAEKQLVGVWRDCLDRNSRYTFSDDGSYAYDDDEPVISRHLRGVYSVAGNIVHVDATDQDGESVEHDYSYYINDTHFVYHALHPEGSHDGVVGTWSAYMARKSSAQTFETKITYYLRADMSLGIREVSGTNVWTEEGTWMPDEYGNIDTYELQLMGEFSRIQLIDDTVLGQPRFCRQVSG